MSQINRTKVASAGPTSAKGATATGMLQLLHRLETVGIQPSFARKTLPNWWDDEIATTPSGLQQAQLYLARAFNLDIVSLANPDALPAFSSENKKYKLAKNVKLSDVAISAHYATAMAKLALRGMPTEQKAVPKKATSLRDMCLRTNHCVDFEWLLDWCLDAGIPVLGIDKLPGRKMTGLVVRDDGRYAIVLSRKGHPSEMLFWLAHELGHIALGHLSSDGFVAEVTIGSNLSMPVEISGGDSPIHDADDEVAADLFAIRLLNGKDAAYGAGNRYLNAKTLAGAATALGKQEHIDPGHIILNFGHQTRKYPLAKMALNHLSVSEDGRALINRKLFDTLPTDFLSEDQQNLLADACTI